MGFFAHLSHEREGTNWVSSSMAIQIPSFRGRVRGLGVPTYLHTADDIGGGGLLGAKGGSDMGQVLDNFLGVLCLTSTGLATGNERE